jgi:FkbM family methyltransferase
LVILAACLLWAVVIGRKLARRVFGHLVALATSNQARLVEFEQSERDQFRVVVGRIDRLEALIDKLESQVLVQLADLSAGHQRQISAWAERIETTLGMFRDSISTYDGRLDRQIADQTAASHRNTSNLERIEGRLDVLDAKADALSSSITALSIPDQIARIERELCDQATAAQRAASRLDGIESRLALLDAKADVLSSSITSATSDSQRLSGQLAKVASTSTELAGLVRTSLLRQCHSVSLDSSVPESQEERVRLAESLAVLRPLVPYPEWRFDADRYNPDLSFQLRYSLWNYFVEHGYDGPVSVPWHLGTRLWLHMNNDVGSQIFVAGCIDPNEFVFLDRYLKAGMTFLDVGANEGIYSVFAARRVGAGGIVWAFEPSKREIGRLRRNAEYNGLDVRVFEIGLSDVTSEADLLIAEDRHAGLNTLGKIPYEQVNQARLETIHLDALDEIVAKNPLARLDMIKIDVEGAELRVLRGAAETLRRYRPLLLFEVSGAALAAQGASPEELTGFVRSQGYILYRFDPRTGFPSAAGAADDCSDNMIAISEECSLPPAVYSLLPTEPTWTDAQVK